MTPWVVLQDCFATVLTSLPDYPYWHARLSTRDGRALLRLSMVGCGPEGKGNLLVRWPYERTKQEGEDVGGDGVA